MVPYSARDISFQRSLFVYNFATKTITLTHIDSVSKILNKLGGCNFLFYHSFSVDQTKVELSKATNDILTLKYGTTALLYPFCKIEKPLTSKNVKDFQ